MVFMFSQSSRAIPKTTLRKLLESKSQPVRFLDFFQRLVSVFLCVFFLTVSAATTSAQPVHEPARGSIERKAILNTIRPLMEARLGAPVEFVVFWMRSGGDWAFAGLDPQRPGGGRINLQNTVYAGQGDYMDGLHTYALLRYQYDRWNIIDFVVGPTDVFWQGDPLYARIPPGLTPH
ncbi:hypothetical protein FJ695_13750 [Labrenzia sp. PHM005]|nr:hypothetical protein FJ695_13750 [Labrenzia sp. PHM005]